MKYSEMAMQKKAMKAKDVAFGQRCMANGGQTQAPAKRQGEGLIEGPGTGTSDSIPIDLPSGSKIAASKHEFIIPADSTAKIGADNLQKMVDATHTPVNKPKSRFGMFDGGPSPLFNELAAEVQRDRIGGPKGLFFGSGNSAQVFTPGAPGSSVLGTSAIPPAAFGGFTHATPTSIASGMPPLPSLATPGAPQYGGMGGGAKIINAGPSVSAPILGAQFGFADGGYAHRTKKYDQTGCAMADGGPVVLTPADKDRMLSLADGGMAGYPQTVMAGMANGGMARKGYAEGGYLGADGVWRPLPDGSTETIDYSKTPTPPDTSYEDWEAMNRRASSQGAYSREYSTADAKPTSFGQPQPPTAEPYPGTEGYSVSEELPRAQFNAGMAGGQDGMSPQAARYDWKSRFFPGGENIPNKNVIGANVRPTVLQEAAQPAAAEVAPAAEAAPDGVLGKAKALFGKGAGAASEAASGLGGKIASSLPWIGAGLEGVNVMQRGSQPGADMNQEIAKGATRYAAGLAAGNAAGALVPPAPGIFGLVRPAAMMAAGAAGYLGADKLLPHTETANTGSEQTPMDPHSDVPSISPQFAAATGVSSGLRASSVGGKGYPDAPIPEGTPPVAMGGPPQAQGTQFGSPSNGIDFGFKPGEVEAYKQGMAGSNFGYAQSPQYQENPDVTDLSGKAAMLAKQIASMGPGSMGRKNATARLAAVTGALDALRGGDAQKNAFNQQTYGNQVGQFGHMLGYQGQLATNQVARQSAKYNYDAKMAEVDNQKYKQSVDEAQQRLTNENPRIEALAGGDKALADSLKVYTAARPFPVIDPKTGRQAIGPDGKPVTKGIQDLPADDKAKAYGIISLMAKKAAALKAVGKPYSLADMDRHTDAGVFGTAYSAVTSPYKTFKFGARTTNDNFLTAEPNTFDTDEEAEADRQQRGGR